MRSRIHIARPNGYQDNSWRGGRIGGGARTVSSAFRDYRAANFNGTDERAYNDTPAMKPDTAGAFAFWWRPASLLGANGTRGMLGLGVNSGANDSCFLIAQFRSANTSNQNRLQLLCRNTNGGTANNMRSTTALVAGTLYHVVMQSNGTAWTCYLNGASETLTLNNGTHTGDWLGDVTGATHRLIFGASWIANAITSYCACSLNECIYVGGRILTGAEVTELYNAGVRKNPRRLSFAADIDAWWRFGDSRDDATTIYDEIGSNNLTLVNMDASNYGTP